jgi:integrase
MTVRTSVEGYVGVFVAILQETYKGQPDKSFYVCWQEDGVKRWECVGRRSRGVTARLAADRRHEILREIRERKPEVPDPKVGEVMGDWTRESGKGFRIVSACRTRILPALGELRLSEVTRPMVESFAADMTASGLAPRSVRINTGYLSAAIDHAVRLGRWDGRNPVSGAVLPRVDNKSERWLTEDEEARLLAELDRRAPWLADAARLSLWTGVRLTEIYRLRAVDLDPDGTSIMIFAKGGKRQALRLRPEAAEILRRRIREEPRPDGLVFGRKDTHVFRRAADACGLNDGMTDRRLRVTFHTLRHTFATRLAKGGISLHALMGLMRHSNIQMTMRYAHHIPDDLADCLKLLDRFMPPVMPPHAPDGTAPSGGTRGGDAAYSMS